MKTVVQISKTPLVGAPARLAEALETHLGYRTLHFYEKEYPEPLSGFFTNKSCHLNLDEKGQRLLFEDAMRSADIVHIHNQCSFRLEQHILELNTKAKFVYHVHSPLREGPLYFRRLDDFRIPWSAFFVVGQIWPRLYPDATPMPNIVPMPPVEAPAPIGDSVRVIYSPSHRRQGRWGTKISPVLDETLKKLGDNELADVFDLKQAVSPYQLTQLRKKMNVTIDEIVTGGFHQISLEGMLCGNVVINGSDEFSIQVMRGWTKSKARPPFVVLDESNVEQELTALVKDHARLQEKAEETLDYGKKYLLPEMLVKRYDEVYRTLN